MAGFTPPLQCLAQLSSRRRSFITPDAGSKIYVEKFACVVPDGGVTPISGFQAEQRQTLPESQSTHESLHFIAEYQLQQYIPNRIRICQGSNPILVMRVHLLGNGSLQLPNSWRSRLPYWLTVSSAPTFSQIVGLWPPIRTLARWNSCKNFSRFGLRIADLRVQRAGR